MRLFTFFLSCLAVFILGAGSARSTPQNHVSVEAVALSTPVAGETFPLAIIQRMEPRWHTYWVNPGDSGEGMTIDWDLPDDVHVGDLHYPTPEKISYDPLVSYGYKRQAVFLVDVTLGNGFSGDIVTIAGTASWLTCDEICIPEKQTFSLSLPLAEQSFPMNEDIAAQWEQTRAKPVDWKSDISFVDGEAILNVAVPDDMVNQMTDVELYPYEWGLMDNQATALASIGDSSVSFAQKAGERDVSNLESSRFIIKTVNGAYEVNADIEPAMVAKGNGTDTNGRNIFVILLFAFIGGVILNLMPCVFPVLSMKAISLVKLSDKERRHAQASGIAYMAGIVLSFLTIAGVLIGLKASGESIGWGFQLQNPYVVTGLATLLFVIGLNLAGLFEIKGRFTSFGSSLTKGNDVKGSFFTGVLATLVATPCSAPFMATAVGYALTQSAFVALLIFAFVGLGLAFPYLLLCFVPKLQKILPKPGAWMETFRQFLAFPMIASAIWLVWVLDQQGGALAVAYILALFLAIVFLIWLFRRVQSRGVKTIVTSIVVVILALNITLLRPVSTLGYVTYSKGALESLLQDEPQKSVFVNMTAAWCITCLVNEKTSLSSDAVKEAMVEADVVYMKGDWTNQNPEITAFLESHGRNGVPLYVFYGKASEDGIRPDPIVLPQILTQDIVISTLKGK